MELCHLDDRTRDYMIDEIQRDIATRALYLSPRLTPAGKRDYPGLLLEAAEKGSPESLAAALESDDRIQEEESRWTPKNRITVAATPFNTAAMLATDQFNRYYIRAVCRRALDDGAGHVEVYRARPVQAPRPLSERLIGRWLPAGAVLDDVRAHQGDLPRLGVPGGFNSGLSVRLPGPGAC